MVLKQIFASWSVQFCLLALSNILISPFYSSVVSFSSSCSCFFSPYNRFKFTVWASDNLWFEWAEYVHFLWLTVATVSQGIWASIMWFHWHVCFFKLNNSIQNHGEETGNWTRRILTPILWWNLQVENPTLLHKKQLLITTSRLFSLFAEVAHLENPDEPICF